MKRIVFLVIGSVLELVGLLWILQGFNLMGQSGGMNGHKIFAVIGIVVALIGLALTAQGIRTKRT